MAACNQTDIPVLNIQEDPCIQGSLVTSCIFYGLAIDYLGAQNSSSFFDVIGLIVAKLEAGNIDATNLEEDNRAQALLIEDLQNSIAESLVTLSEVQVLLDECCPEPTTTTSTTTTPTTTTTSTTTTAPTTTTTSTTTPVVSYNFTVSASSTSDPVYRCENPYTSGQQTLWAATSIPGDVQKFYTDSNLINPYIGNVNDYYAYMIGWPSGILYKGQMGSDGTIFNKSTCEATTTTTTVGPTQMFDVYLIQSNVVNNDLDLFSSLTNVTRVYLPGGQIFGQVGAQLFLDEELTLSLNFPGNARMWIQPTGSNEVYDYYSTFLGSTTYEHFNSNVRSVSWIYSNSGLNGVSYRSSDSRVYGLNIPRIAYYNVNEGYQIGTQMYYDYALSMPINENNQLHVANGLYSTPLTTDQENQNIYYIAPSTGIVTSISGIVKDYAWAQLVGGSPKVSNTGYCDGFYGNGVSVPPGVPTNQVNIGQTVYQSYNQNTGQYDTLNPYWTYFEYNNQAYTVLNGTIQSTHTCTTTTTVAPTTTTTSTTTVAPTTTTTSTTTIAPGITNFSIIGENPRAIIMDAQGNVYTANSNSDDITKITLSGAVSILGSTGRNPTDLVMDSSGNIYTANFQGNSITKVTPEGVSTQFATLGFVSPSAIAIDSLGNLYTANSQTNNVSKITPSGNVSILGTAGTSPYGIVVDAQDNIYVSNFSSNNVTKITPLGVSTVLGNTGIGPREIAIDAQGNIYTANSSSNTVTKITPAGVSTTLGSTGSFPIGITIDSSGNVYTANINGNSVTRITPSGEATSFPSNGVFPDDLVTGFGYLFVTNASESTVSRIPLSTTTTIAPTTTTTTVAPGTLGFLGNFGDGPDQILFDTVGNTYLSVQNIDQVIKLNPAFTSSNFFTDNNAFYSFVIDSNNNIFALSISEENAIKKITPSGQVSTFINSLTNGLGKRMTIDSLDNIFVTNTDTTVKKITPSGVVSSFGSVSTAPYGVITDSQNNLYVAELMDKTISKFTPSGTKTTVATLADNPIHFAVDSSDNLYTSCSNGTIFKTTPSGITTTLAIVQRADDITIDTIGNVYVTDVISDKIYKVTPSGTVTDFYSIANLKSILEIQSEYLYFGLFTGNTYRIKL